MLEHNKELLVYTCEECKKNYTSPSSLKCHQASRHQGLVTKLPLNVRVRVGSKRSAESLPTQAKKAKITDPSKVKFRTITRSMATTSTEITPKLLLPTPEQPVYQLISPPRPSTSEDDQPAVIHQMPASIPLFTVPSPVLPIAGPTHTLSAYLGNMLTTSSDFNLSQYLTIPPELKQSTPKVAPYPPPATFRPWTPSGSLTATTPSPSTLASPVLNVEADHQPPVDLPIEMPSPQPSTSKWDPPSSKSTRTLTTWKIQFQQTHSTKAPLLCSMGAPNRLMAINLKTHQLNSKTTEPLCQPPPTTLASVAGHM